MAGENLAPGRTAQPHLGQSHSGHSKQAFLLCCNGTMACSLTAVQTVIIHEAAVARDNARRKRRHREVASFSPAWESCRSRTTRSKGRSPSPARLLRKEEVVHSTILNIPGAMTPLVVSKTETFSMQPVLTVPDGWPGRLPSSHLQITPFGPAAHSPVPA